MYACILEIGCGFFGGVCAPGNATAYFRDPPPRSKELKKAPQPPQVPFEMLHSTKVECEGDPTCPKSYSLGPQIERDVVQQWPEGCFREVAASHDIYEDKIDLVEDAVKHPCAK